jgi:3-methylcrotonyl-CoA carboxylase beta subunit
MIARFAIMGRSGATFRAVRAFRTIAGAGPLTALPADAAGAAAAAASHAANRAHNERLLERLQEASAHAALGGGEKAIARHTLKNKKMLVRDRIARLVDGKGFFELSQLCGLGGLYGGGHDVQCGGAVCGIGRIHGRHVMILASDATVTGGAMYPITVRKQLRAQEIARQNRLPCYYIVDSAGAFLPLQADIFPDKEHGGRAFYNQAQLSALGVPQVAIVPGSCTAGGAYMCTMSDEAVIVKDLGFVYLGGPPLVKAATGEVVTDKELGGAEVHCALSGCTDHFAEDEDEAIAIGRDIAETLPLWAGEADTPGGDGERPTGVGSDHDADGEMTPLYPAEELLSLIPAAGGSEAMPMRQVLARILDRSELHEHRPRYGETLICGFARIGGSLVGVIANNGPLLGRAADQESSGQVEVGASASPAALKGAHFIELCNQRRVPLVLFTDIRDEEQEQRQGRDGENVALVLSEKEQIAWRRRKMGAVRDVGKMMAALANASVPKISLLAGSFSGVTAYAMGGRAMDASFVFAWPNATVSMGGAFHSGQGAEQGGGSPVRDAWYSSARMWDDGVISPLDTRNVLSHALKIVRRQLEPRYDVDEGAGLGVMRM